jgi:cytosine permease
MLSAGVGVALGSVLVAALLCHFGFYYLPARFGQKTGLPLYIVGSSTFGATGGFLLPGFLMGLLQFGWLAVNIWGSSMAMNQMFNFSGVPLYIVMAIWGIAAVVAALAGIQYVAKFSTYLPLIPAIILIALVAKTVGGLGSFDPAVLVKASAVAAVPAAGAAAKGMSAFGVFATRAIRMMAGISGR